MKAHRKLVKNGWVYRILCHASDLILKVGNAQIIVISNNFMHIYNAESYLLDF